MATTYDRNSQLKANGGSHSEEEWETLKRTFYFCCAKCGAKEGDVILSKDHVFPVSKGGTDDISNIQPLCIRCNTSKLNRFAIDYRDSFFHRNRSFAAKVKDKQLMIGRVNMTLPLRGIQQGTKDLQDYITLLGMVEDWGLEGEILAAAKRIVSEWVGING